MQQYWTQLELDHVTKKGRNVYKFKCNICGCTYKNSSNAAAHCENCLKKHNHAKKYRYLTIIKAFGLEEGDEVPEDAIEPLEIQPRKNDCSGVISKEHRALIELIAEENIPYTQIESDSWENFIHMLNPGFVIPSKTLLRKLILDHSTNLFEKGLEDLRGCTCGLAVDGATLKSIHVYAFVLVFQNGLRLAGFKKVDSQTSSQLAQAISSVIQKCNDHDITICCIVSDNAASLKSAIENANLSNSLTLKVLIGEEMLRCACAAHTSQLAIKDLIKGVPFLEEFMQDVINLISFISTHSDDFQKFCPYKMPHFIETRWNTLYNCSSFILENADDINSWLTDYQISEELRFEKETSLYEANKRRTPPNPIVNPPMKAVPEDWVNYIPALEVISEFTDNIEGDLKLQQDVYVSVVEAESKLKALTDDNNFVAEILLEKFEERFKTTADLTLAHLAFIFTAVGLDDFRNTPNDAEKKKTRKNLKKKYLEICNILTQKKYTQNTHFLPALFDYYIDRVEFGTGEDPFAFWKYCMDESAVIEHVNDGNPIPLDTFSSIALCIISFPASEAMIERAFSQIKAISTKFNSSMLIDFFLAIATIKIAKKYSRKYSLQEFKS